VLGARVKVKIQFTLSSAMKAQRGSRSMAVLFLSLGARCGGWITPRPGLFISGNDRIPIAKEAG